MGLWTKGIERSKTNEKRLEDTSPIERYLSKVEWVDLGHDVLYARWDCPLDYKINSELFSFNEIMDILSIIPEDISIMNKNHVKWLQDNCKIIKYQDDDDKLNNKITSICCIGNNHDYIHFNLNMSTEKQLSTYFIKNRDLPDRPNNLLWEYFRNKLDNIELTEIGPNKFPSYLGTVKRISTFKSECDIKKYNIKFVKLKINEKIK